MEARLVTLKDWAKAIGVGVATAAILSLVMVPASKAGISPMPKPLGLAFAQVLLGEVPLPVGLLFHVVYVTFWSVVYIALFDRRTFLGALGLALGLWVLVLVFFFPIVGWGFFGLGVSPKLIVASLVPHLLFAIVLWGICRWAFPTHPDKVQASA
ncbi:MAG: hypothetical protein A3G24_18385 [Betaproteobacteria bacterium RIFCSPLOWO2_12_FULL_62_13]|nr:MAG: hypothetical protein A3G24_18385 [Betaproteobacteria bacterium RIFCSPLOWO2_12_FULL_62_13]